MEYEPKPIRPDFKIDTYEDLSWDPFELGLAPKQVQGRQINKNQLFIDKVFKALKGVKTISVKDINKFILKEYAKDISAEEQPQVQILINKIFTKLNLPLDRAISLEEFTEAYASFHATK